MPVDQPARRSEAAEKVIEEARVFLAPAALSSTNPNPDGKSAAKKIANSHSKVVGTPVSDDVLRRVVLDACSHLKAVHNTLTADERQGNSYTSTVMDTGLVSAVYRLLDLILLEGVYPSLAPGVGIQPERQKRSRLCNKYAKAPKDLNILVPILYETLNDIAFGKEGGIKSLVRDRVLIDLIAAHTDVAFSPSRDGLARQTALEKLNFLLEIMPVSSLYPVLTSLLRPSAPDWFRSALSEYLSLLLLRPHGVRHAIEFIAASYHVQNSSSKDEDNPKPSQGPSLSPEGLIQATKLLSAVPIALTPDIYFTRLAPQLLNIIDGEDGLDMSYISAFIISGGILSKKTLGSPGTIGWKLFAEPQILAVNPRLPPELVSLNTNSHNQRSKPITSEIALSTALKRLRLLVHSHPSPALTGRLLRPLLLPLWGLAAYDESAVAANYWTETTLDLLKEFLKRCGNVDHLKLLSSSLLWNGTPDWTFGPGSEGGIEIRAREKTEIDPNMIELVSRIQGRISKFMQLLSNDTVDDEVIGTLFLHLTREWLLPQPIAGKGMSLTIESDSDPMLDLAQAQLTQIILQQFGDKLASRPAQILELIEQLLQRTVETAKQDERRKQAVDKATLSGLSNIVAQDTASHLSAEISSFPADQSEDMVATAVSLLNTLISTPEFKMSKENTSTLDAVLSRLRSISKAPPAYLSLSTTSSIQASISIITNLLKPPSNSDTPPQLSLQPVDQEILTHISSDLSSNLAPVRTSAIQAVQKLVTTSNLQLDVPTISFLLLGTIRSDEDEYVYLAAIATLVKLAVTRDVGFVSRLLVDTFQDAQEVSGLDGRLRVGEALSGLVESMIIGPDGQHVHATRKSRLLRSIAEAVLKVAGRRGQRKREMIDRDKREQVDRIKKRQAERIWGGEVPDLGELSRGDDEDVDVVAREQELRDNEIVQGILKNWEDTGLEEDVRLRTSALSILGQILEQATSELTPELINSAADTALSILSFERGPGKMILRRAAVLMFMSLLRAMDKAHESGKEIATGLDGSKWLGIEKVLSWVTDVDEDDIVKGNATSVLEGLEAWRMKKIMGAGAGNDSSNTPTFGLDTLRGLNVTTGSNPSIGRMKVQEID